VRLARPRGGGADIGDGPEARTVELRGVGGRWLGVDLDAVLRPAGD